MSKPAENERVVCLVTASSHEEALRIADHLVAEKLAACVNVVPGIESVYTWEGSIEHDEEWLLIIKSNRAIVSELATSVKKLHSYDVPEVIALPIVDGSADYLNWIGKVVK